MKKDIGSLRSTLEYLEAAGELVTTDVEVDPDLEVAAIQKHFDGGAALLFNKVKGYPNARICNNLFASAERIAGLFMPGTPSVASLVRYPRAAFWARLGLVSPSEATAVTP